MPNKLMSTHREQMREQMVQIIGASTRDQVNAHFCCLADCEEGVLRVASNVFCSRPLASSLPAISLLEFSSSKRHAPAVQHPSRLAIQRLEIIASCFSAASQ